MKKIILLVTLIFILTGCQSTYEINFTEQNIKEEITISTENKNIKNATQTTINKVNEEIMTWEENYEFYNKIRFSTDEITGYKYTYDFSYDQYNVLSQLGKCYDELTLENDNIITLKTSKEFICSEYHPNVKQVLLTIKSDYKILSSNADTKNDNTHIWIINKSNYKNKPISIKIDKTTKNTEKEEKKESKLNLKMILVFIIFFILVGYLIINRKKSQ